MSVTFDTGQYTASATAGIMLPADLQRTGLLLVNTSGTAFYVGGTGVTAATGHLVPGVVGASVSIPTHDSVSVITSAGTALLTYVETRQL
jgi:hypothetical protein